MTTFQQRIADLRQEIVAALQSTVVYILRNQTDWEEIDLLQNYSAVSNGKITIMYIGHDDNGIYVRGDTEDCETIEYTEKQFDALPIEMLVALYETLTLV